MTKTKTFFSVIWRSFPLKCLVTILFCCFPVLFYISFIICINRKTFFEFEKIKLLHMHQNWHSYTNRLTQTCLCYFFLIQGKIGLAQKSPGLQSYHNKFCFLLYHLSYEVHKSHTKSTLRFYKLIKACPFFLF